MGNNPNRPLRHGTGSASSPPSSSSSSSSLEGDPLDGGGGHRKKARTSGGGSGGPTAAGATAGTEERPGPGAGADLEREIEAKLVSARKTYALDLQGCGLKAVPRGVFELSELSSLNLSNNELTALEDAVVRDLPALSSLRLNGNKLTGLPSLSSRHGSDGSGGGGGDGERSSRGGVLEELELLDVGKNRLRSLPSSVGALASLARLIAHCNLLDELPAEVGRLEQLTALDLSTNNLRCLPPELGRLTKLKSLDIDNNRLRDLPAEFADLSSLTQLTCSSNLFAEFPEALCQLGRAASLKTLNFSCNRISQLPPTVTLLTDSLTELDLSGNRFMVFPEPLAGCRSLITLKLHHNKLRDVALNIAQLGELATFDLSYNKLTSLPPELGAMTVLMELDLSHNKLATLPPELGQLSFLGKLLLRHNCLSPSLPTELASLAFVQDLDLSHNGLTSMPVELFRLDKLQSLKLDSNNLTALPAELGCLFRLNHLSVANNRLKALPAELTQLSRLQALSVYQNEIKQLPEGLGTLKHLEMLCLGDNLLDEAGCNALFSEKTTLPELEQLILSGNRLTSIPEGLCSLTTLKELYLNRNEIAEMPPSFTQLQKLRILDLADNNISLLPPFITSLSSLREINFSYNRLSSLPPEIVKLTNLSVLYLMHNKLTELPQYLQAMRNGNCYHMDLEDNLIPNLTSLLAGTKKKKRKRSTSKQDNEKLNKYKDEKSRVAGISEMMGKRPHMEDTVSSHLAFSGIDGDDFFAVFDGHAGRASAVFAADHFHWVLAKKVMEERESGLSSTTNRAKGKEKGSFWNRSRQRTKPPKDLPPKPLPETEPSSPHQSEQRSSKNDEVLEEKKEEKEKEKEEDEGDPCTDADDRQPPQSKTGVAEADEDREEETIDFPKDVGNDSGREEQAAFSALVKSFLEMDELMKDNRDGATAVVTLASMRLRKLFVANVGDARAVLCRRGKAFPLTVDHTPKLLAESERIRALHGFVTSNRVNGVIAISRSLGDASMKPYVSAEPGTCVVNLCREDQFLILACDGCWDTVDNQTAVDIVSAELAVTGNPAKAAIKLRDQAFWRGSSDNISVIVVLLDRYLPRDHSSSSITSSSSSLGLDDEKRCSTPVDSRSRLGANIKAAPSANNKRLRDENYFKPQKSSESDPNLSKQKMHNNNADILPAMRRSMSEVFTKKELAEEPAQVPDSPSTGATKKGSSKTKRKTNDPAASDGKGVQKEAVSKKEKDKQKKKKKKDKKDKKDKMDNPKKHRKHKVKEQRVRSRSRSVADAEESPQYGRNRAFSAEKDTCSMRNRSSRSSSLSEEPIDARKGLQELMLD